MRSFNNNTLNIIKGITNLFLFLMYCSFLHFWRKNSFIILDLYTQDQIEAKKDAAIIYFVAAFVVLLVAVIFNVIVNSRVVKIIDAVLLFTFPIAFSIFERSWFFIFIGEPEGRKCWRMFEDIFGKNVQLMYRISILLLLLICVIRTIFRVIGFSDSVVQTNEFVSKYKITVLVYFLIFILIFIWELFGTASDRALTVIAFLAVHSVVTIIVYVSYFILISKTQGHKTHNTEGRFS